MGNSFQADYQKQLSCTIWCFKCADSRIHERVKIKRGALKALTVNEVRPNNPGKKLWRCLTCDSIQLF